MSLQSKLYSDPPYTLCHSCHGESLEVDIGYRFCEICNNINSYIDDKIMIEIILKNSRLVKCHACDNLIYIKLENSLCKLCDESINWLEKIMIRAMKLSKINVSCVSINCPESECGGYHNEDNINLEFIYKALDQMDNDELQLVAKKVFSMLNV